MTNIGRTIRTKLVMMTLCLGLVGSFGVLNAPVASAEPTGYWQQCHMNSQVFSVNSPRECADGTLTIRSLRDNSVLYRIYLWNIKWNVPRYNSWAEAQKGCYQSVLCTGAYVWTVGRFILPLQIAWAMFANA